MTQQRISSSSSSFSQLPLLLLVLVLICFVSSFTFAEPSSSPTTVVTTSPNDNNNNNNNKCVSLHVLDTLRKLHKKHEIPDPVYSDLIKKGIERRKQQQQKERERKEQEEKERERNSENEQSLLLERFQNWMTTFYLEVLSVQDRSFEFAHNPSDYIRASCALPCFLLGAGLLFHMFSSYYHSLEETEFPPDLFDLIIQEKIYNKEEENENHGKNSDGDDEAVRVNALRDILSKMLHAKEELLVLFLDRERTRRMFSFVCKLLIFSSPLLLVVPGYLLVHGNLSKTASFDTKLASRATSTMQQEQTSNNKNKRSVAMMIVFAVPELFLDIFHSVSDFVIENTQGEETTKSFGRSSRLVLVVFCSLIFLVAVGFIIIRFSQESRQCSEKDLPKILSRIKKHVHANMKALVKKFGERRRHRREQQQQQEEEQEEGEGSNSRSREEVD